MQVLTRRRGNTSTVAQRFVLARPHGGLNDTLGVVAKAWRCAEAHERALVVDARRSHFASRFDQFFTPRQPSPEVLFRPTPRVIASMNSLTCNPSAVQGRLHSYTTEMETHETLSHLEWLRPVDSLTGESLAPDLDLVAGGDEGVVLFEGFDGRPESVDVFERVWLTPRVRRLVVARLRCLVGADYVGLHVRNTDLQSDHVGFFEHHADHLAGRTVVVCSDDGAVVATARHILARSTVVSPSDVPVADGTPYQAPFHPGRRARRKLALDTLVDLFALGGATEVLHPEVLNRTVRVSGFSRLASDLSQRPRLVAELLAGRTIA
jgi:hypothetical protein